MPASRIAKPIALFLGSFQTVADDDQRAGGDEQAGRERMAGRAEAGALPARARRKTNSAAPVSPNQMKSTDTT